MTVAYVQNKGNQSASSSTLAVAFNSAVTAGNLLVVFHANGGTNIGQNTSTTPTDTLGETYVQTDAESSAAGAASGHPWYKENCSGGANTVTLHGIAGMEMTGEIAEFSGVSTASALDTHNVGRGTSSVSSSPSITPTNTGALIVAMMADEGGSTVVPTWSNGGTGATFTAIPLSSVISNGANQRCGFAYAIDSNGGTYIARATVNGGVSAAWVSFIAAFNPSTVSTGGGAAAVIRRLGLMGAGL